MSNKYNIKNNIDTICRFCIVFFVFVFSDSVFENSKQNPPTNRFIDGFCVLYFTNGIVNCVLLQQDANHAAFALVDDTPQCLAQFLFGIGGNGLQFVVDSVRDEG